MTKQALLIVDHGSRRKEANDMLEDVLNLIRKQKPHLIVNGAHMELAEPDIAAGIKRCVLQGANHIIVQPMMLTPGRHAMKDIPDLVKQAMADYPHVTSKVSAHIGPEEKLAELLIEKAGI